jgi:hypothetical protein
LGENVFPSVEILLHVRGQAGTRMEETAGLFDLVEQTVRQTIPPDQRDKPVDDIDLPSSSIKRALPKHQNHRR